MMAIWNKESIKRFMVDFVEMGYTVTQDDNEGLKMQFSNGMKIFIPRKLANEYGLRLIDSIRRDRTEDDKWFLKTFGDSHA